MTTQKRNHRDIYHAEVVTLLHFYKAFTRSQESGKFSQTEPGSADIMVHLHGGCAVEVKTASAGTFRFSEWRDNQRQWAENYETNTGNQYWLAVVYEVDKCPWPSLRVPRHPFLIPRSEMVYTIASIPQESLPYIAGKGINKEMQEGQLDALHLWKSYSLVWNSGWKIPVTHPFAKAYSITEDQ